MIIFDTETTGLLKPGVVPLDQQPEVIEFAAIKLDADLQEVDRLHFNCCPRTLPLDPKIEKITGLTTEMIRPCPRFSSYTMGLIGMFLGERQLVAHNIAFDVEVLHLELQRLGMATRFPWPPMQIDTVELTMDLEGIDRKKSPRLSLGQLYSAATGRAPETKHRALSDVESLVTVVRWLRATDDRI